MATEFIDITAPSIDTTAFKDLSQDILDNLVNGDASPFKEAKSIMEDYLDNAVDLDDTQKAGLFAEFLKSSFQQIIQQANGTAVDILKSNAQLELDTYRTTGEYIQAKANVSKTDEEAAVIGKQAARTDEEITLVREQWIAQQAVRLETMAKLKKQYGYADATVNADLDPDVVAALTALRATLVDDVLIAQIDETLAQTVAALGTSSADGALDKQILGYDKVNYKDALKAINEMTALLVNAQVVPGPWLVDIQKILVELITLNPTGGATGTGTGINIKSGNAALTDSTSNVVEWKSDGMNGFVGLSS